MSWREDMCLRLSPLWRWVPEALLQMSPMLAEWRRQTAQLYAQRATSTEQHNDLAQATGHLIRAVELEPHGVAFLNALGRLHFKQKKLADARDCFQRALGEDFDDMDAWKGLGFTLDEQGKPDEAIYCYLKYLQVRPEDFEVHANLIEALAAVGKFTDAIRAAESCCEQFPRIAGFPFLAGRCHFDVGNLQAALKHFKKALELSPDSPEIHRFLGSALAATGDMEQALEQFRASLALDPDNAYAYLNMARLFDRTQRDSEYLEAAQNSRRCFQAREDQDGLKHAYWEVGWAYYKLHQWAESIEASEAALSIDGAMASVRFNLGLAWLRTGELARAKIEYRKALQLGDFGSLKSMAIPDLEGALKEEPGLPGGKELLAELQEACATAAADVQTTTRRSRQKKSAVAAGDEPLVVMGVSGSGKTTVGSLLAKKMGLPFIDADDLQSAQNRQKLATGIPLTAEEESSWLEAVSKRLSSAPAVVACPALRRICRDKLRKAAPQLRLLYLAGPLETLAQRTAEKTPARDSTQLVRSQLNMLEIPGADERVLTVNATLPVSEIINSALSWYKAQQNPAAPLPT